MNRLTFTALIVFSAASLGRNAAASSSEEEEEEEEYVASPHCPVGWYAAVRSKACYTSVYVAKQYKTDYYTASQRCAAEHPHGHLPFFYRRKDYNEFNKYMRTVYQNQLYETWIFSYTSSIGQNRPKRVLKPRDRTGKPNLHNPSVITLRRVGEGLGKCKVSKATTLKDTKFVEHVCDTHTAHVTCQVYRGDNPTYQDDVKAKKVSTRYVSGSFACPEGWSVVPGAWCYKLLMDDPLEKPIQAKYDDASVYCQMEHEKAELVNINKFARLVMLTRYVKDFNENTLLYPIWLQARDLNSEGIWRDKGKTTVNFTGGWTSGHPTNYRAHDCMVAGYSAGTSHHHRFQEVDCDTKKYVVCQLQSKRYMPEDIVDDSTDVCPVGWWTGMNVCIKMPFIGATMKMSHSRGMAECKRLHPRAFLPMFRSFIEWNQFTTFLKLTKMHKKPVWIGARAIPKVMYDIGGNITSAFPGFSNWKVGHTEGLYNDACFVREIDGRWADMDCSTEMPVICMLRKEDAKYRQRPISKCPNGWFSIEGSCLLPPEDGKWDVVIANKTRAGDDCYRKNPKAHLPYFLNRQEYAKYADFRRQLMIYESTFMKTWLNGNDEDVSDDFRLDYADGLRVRYVPFNSGHPQNSKSYQCLVIEDVNGVADIGCDAKNAYLCQIYDLEYFERSVAYSLLKHRNDTYKKAKVTGAFDLRCLIRMAPFYGGDLKTYGITPDQYYSVYKHDVPDYKTDPKCKEHAALFFVCITLCESICHTNIRYIGCDVKGNKCNCSGGLGCGDNREWNKVYKEADIGETIEGMCMKCRYNPAVCLSSWSEIQSGKKGGKISSPKKHNAFMLRVKKK